MKNKIFLKDLSFLAIVGIYPHEKEKRQSILVDLELEIDSFHGAIEKDEIHYSVDYEKIYQTVNKTVVDRNFNLLETLAYQVVLNCFKISEKIDKIKIKVTKPNAITATKNLGIKIILKRGEVKL